MKQLRDRVGVVTGAANGIGHALAGRFTAEGMRVALADVDVAPLEHAVDELRATDADVVGGARMSLGPKTCRRLPTALWRHSVASISSATTPG